MQVYGPGTIWWRAKFINADLLKELLTHFKPYMFLDNIPHYTETIQS